jgi:hypothetical protein
LQIHIPRWSLKMGAHGAVRAVLICFIGEFFRMEDDAK